MMNRFHAHFIASSLALSLAGPIALGDTGSASKRIGLVKLSEPLPFTPQDLIEPFGWRLRLTEHKEKGEVLVHSFLGSHIFTFYRDTDQKIRRIYSPLYKDDSDLCQSFHKLRDVRPFIHDYLEKNFQASENCRTPQIYPSPVS